MEAMVDAVSLTVNGKPIRLAAGTTVQDFLASTGYHDRLVVVELNEAILSRSAFASTVLSDDDRLEIVHFVGGG